MVQNILTADDFQRILNDYAGRTLSHTPRTVNRSGYNGKETFSDGTPTDIQCYFLKQQQNWVFDKASKIEGGDAVLLAKYTDSVDKDDKITADGEVYVIKDIIHVPGVFNVSGNPTFIYSYCNLYLYDGS